MSPMDALQHKLEQLSAEREALMQTIEQNETDIETLQQQLDSSESLVETLKTEQTRLSNVLGDRESELEATGDKLAEREAMLTQVMSFLQGKKDEDEEEAGENTQVNVLESGRDFVKEFEEQLMLAERQRDELMAAVEQLTEALQVTQAELAQTQQTTGDKIDELETELTRVAPFEARAASLAEQVADLTAQREQLQAELAETKETNATLSSELEAKSAELSALREELAALDDNMRKAAHAGLSLSEMINQLKEQHASREAELLTEIKALRAQLDDYEARLERLRDLFPGGDGDGGDIIEQLQHRLEVALRQREEMENLLEELQSELEQKIAELEAVSKERDELSSKLAQAEALIAEIQEELSTANTEVDRLKELLGKAAQAMQLEGYEPGEDGEEPDFSQEGLDALIAELEARLQHIIKLEGAIEELNEQSKQLQAQLAAMEAAKQELMDELLGLRTDKQRLEHEMEVLQSKLLLGQEQIKMLELEVKSLKRIQKRNERTITQQKATIEQLRKLLAAYQDTGVSAPGGDYVNDPQIVKRFKEMEQEINSLLSEIDDLQNQLDKERDFFRKKFLKKWGQNTLECEGCSLEFSLTLRRHHCRMCGGVYCIQCCNDRVQTSASRRPVRVCHDCNEFLLKIEEEDTEKARLKEQAVLTYGDMHEVVIQKTVSSEPLGMEVAFDFEETEDGKELTAELIRVTPDGLAARSGVRTKDLIIRIGNRTVADMNSKADASSAMASNPLRLWVKSIATNSPDKGPKKQWIEDIKSRVRSNTTLSGQSPIGSPQLSRASPRNTRSPPSVYSTPLGQPNLSLPKLAQGRDSPSRLSTSTTVHANPKPPVKPMPRLSTTSEGDESTENGSADKTAAGAQSTNAITTPADDKPLKPVDKTVAKVTVDGQEKPKPKRLSQTQSELKAGDRKDSNPKVAVSTPSDKVQNPFAELHSTSTSADSSKAASKPSSPLKAKPGNPFAAPKAGSKSAPVSSTDLLPDVPKSEPGKAGTEQQTPSSDGGRKKRLPSDLFD
eukprot:TRINITY_DN11423_c0_g1_i1.p1 TRINITY_DN11423_c0_g1~~TRINITY_DN11423_c0_g1_i1.p1  ORF type:complete len:1183 (+),score=410.21 TRINITY_DN11423_c0_g1_i1:493-3549(+)